MTQFKGTSENYDEASGMNAVCKTGTDSSQAVTVQSRRGRITSSTTTLAADTVEAITVTCKYSKTTSTILANVRGGGAAVGALSVNVDPSSANGAFVVRVRNNTSATAANAAYVVDFLIINDND